MLNNKKHNTKKSVSGNIDSNLLLILKNATIQTFIFILFCFTSFVIGVRKTDLHWISMFSLIIGSIISGLVSGRTKRQKGLFYGALFALPFNLLFFVISLLINRFSFDYSLPVNFVATIFFSSLGGVLSVNYKRKIKSRH